MSALDWVVLLATLFGMVAYGVYHGRGQSGADTFLLAGKRMPWYVVLLGVMATQASAITFLSAPGQAYTDGMRFIQYYFGLPLAMVVICITFIPRFRQLQVYTAYEYLEQRFDRRMRVFTAFLFLLSRGLSTGISIYAPAIILSSILGWNVYVTNLLTGGLLIIYTWTGGAKAIAYTQKLQFLVILSAIAVAGFLIQQHLPVGMGLKESFYLAGKAGRLNIITTHFDWKDKYNIWSGIIGGFFLALSYFGTDQSQVGRYITAKSDDESRLGLLMNGLVKVPMQFLILLVGALLFSFYQLRPAPIHFNDAAWSSLKAQKPRQAGDLEQAYNRLSVAHAAATYTELRAWGRNGGETDSLLQTRAKRQQALQGLRARAKSLMKTGQIADENDTNYVFLYFVKTTLPHGLVGLLFAAIFLAAWGSISAALNALAASSMMDIVPAASHARSPRQQLRIGRMHTLAWGLFCIGVAMFATRMGSLIEAVNVLGSLFYGVILGIFLVAFYAPEIGGRSVFLASVLAEVVVIWVFAQNAVSFLWLNLIGAMAVWVFAWVFSKLYPEPRLIVRHDGRIVEG